MSLEGSLRDVEHLYHDSVVKEDFFKDCEEDCVCLNCGSKKLLRERIKKNLREVLCDLIVLQKLNQEDTILEFESCP